MTKSEMEKRIGVLEADNRLLRARADFAATELAEISQGVAPTPAWYDKLKNNWAEVVRWRAAKAVEHLARMKNP